MHAVLDTTVVVTHRILLWVATYLVLRSRVYEYSYIQDRVSSNMSCSYLLYQILFYGLQI